jgi:hypothetical protein
MQFAAVLLGKARNRHLTAPLQMPIHGTFGPHAGGSFGIIERRHQGGNPRISHPCLNPQRTLTHGGERKFWVQCCW